MGLLPLRERLSSSVVTPTTRRSHSWLARRNTLRCPIWNMSYTPVVYPIVSVTGHSPCSKVAVGLDRPRPAIPNRDPALSGLITRYRFVEVDTRVVTWCRTATLRQSSGLLLPRVIGPNG